MSPHSVHDAPKGRVHVVNSVAIESKRGSTSTSCTYTLSNILLLIHEGVNSLQLFANAFSEKYFCTMAVWDRN